MIFRNERAFVYSMRFVEARCTRMGPIGQLVSARRVERWARWERERAQWSKHTANICESYPNSQPTGSDLLSDVVIPITSFSRLCQSVLRFSDFTKTSPLVTPVLYLLNLIIDLYIKLNLVDFPTDVRPRILLIFVKYAYRTLWWISRWDHVPLRLLYDTVPWPPALWHTANSLYLLVDITSLYHLRCRRDSLPSVA